jgi:hypothetical protein
MSEMKVILHFPDVPTVTLDEITDGVVRILTGQEPEKE